MSRYWNLIILGALLAGGTLATVTGHYWIGIGVFAFMVLLCAAVVLLAASDDPMEREDDGTGERERDARAREYVDEFEMRLEEQRKKTP